MSGSYGDEVRLPFDTCYATASFTPTATEYTGGDIMGTAQRLQFVDRAGRAIAAGSIVRVLASMLKIASTAVPSGQGAYTLHLYRVTPPSAPADNSAWTGASADRAAYVGSVPLGTPTDLGAFLFVKTSFIDQDFRLSTDSLWGLLVNSGTHTPEAVAREVEIIAITP